MKKVTFTPHFSQTFSQLKKPVNDLYFLGTDLAEYESKRRVAIVGSRTPTPYGREVTIKFAEALAQAGIVIVSGLAIGIDATAHKAMLGKKGQGIAVLPSGLNNIYPATNQSLAEKLLSCNGTLLSEYASTHRPRKVEFLERNRLIAALAEVVLIPEAAARSGSLNTAKHAISLGIPVAVIPGNITSIMSEGTNQLLKDGALAVTSPKDILQFLSIDSDGQLPFNLEGETDIESLLLQHIARGIVQSHELQAAVNISSREFQTTLSMLEIQGRIRGDEAGNWHIL